MSWRWQGLIALVVTLAACTTNSPRETIDQAAPADGWRLQARLALANGRDGGSGTLDWAWSADYSNLSFVGAFGRGSWRLQVWPGQASLTLADGRRFTASDVNELVRDHTGWAVPVAALVYWVQGLPQPDFPYSADRDKDDRLRHLRQHEWTVRFEGRLPAGSDWLPRKITAEKNASRVRLLVRKWAIDSPD